MSKKQPEPKTQVTPAYEPTPYERTRLEAYLAGRKERPLAPKLTVKRGKSGKFEVSADHPDPAIGSLLLMESLGTRNGDFFDGILGQVVNAATQGRDPDERDVNFMLSVIKGVEPTDELEAMLAAQMAAVHMATMTFARRLNHVENIPQQDSAERAFNKLARTFTAQIEALKRYRSKGEQKMTVEHVTVNEGGQAIVGNVESGGGGASKKSGTTP